MSLKQYTSALEGFRLIIQQNPYTYEGLVASWDFAATHLLDSLGGSSGGYNGKTEEKLLTAFDITNRYDSTKFTKKQRIEISKSVNDILENKRITQTEKIETLQKKSEEGNSIGLPFESNINFPPIVPSVGIKFISPVSLFTAYRDWETDRKSVV